MIASPQLFVKTLMAVSAATVFLSWDADAKDDPTKEETALYEALKARFNDNKALAIPAAADAKDDPRIDVSEFMKTENTPTLIAKKDCPDKSTAKKVEIYASFRLLHWETGGEHAGAAGTEHTSKEPIDDKGKPLEKVEQNADGSWPPFTLKVTYKYYVMFDLDVVIEPTDDRYLKWFNLSLFYHEMLHGQLTYNRIKQADWIGWDDACKGKMPNPDFIKKGVKAADVEHEKIEPAQTKLLKTALEAKEKFEVTVLEITGEADKKDDQGNRTFKKEIALPEKFKKKIEDGITTSQKELKNVSHLNDVKVDEDKNTVTVSGAIGGDKPGRLLVYVDPPNLAALVFLNITLPSDAVIATAIDCDCNNTTVADIGGAATRQCSRHEQSLRQSADKDAIKLNTVGGVIKSSNTPLCDSVASGPAAWPRLGAPADSPFAIQTPALVCTAEATPGELVAAECGR